MGGPPVTTGQLVRLFREAAGVTQAELAASIFRCASAVCHWEANRKRISRSDLERIDEALDAGGALGDLAFALRTPITFPARHGWRHNFSSDCGPVWAWIRSDSDERLTGDIRWGPYRIAVECASPRTGLIVTSSFSVPNPPVLVELSAPGWVDFGRGIAPDWLPVPVVAGEATISVTDSPHNETIGLVAEQLRSMLNRYGRSCRELADFLQLREGLVAEILGRCGQRSTTQRIPPLRSIERPGQPTAARLIDIRMGRGIKQRELPDLVASLPKTSMLPRITLHHVRAVESGGRPRVAQLIARLDCLYRCDGRLAFDVVAGPGVGAAHVTFPAFWVGPVWLELDPGESNGAEVDIVWGPYRRSLAIEGPTAVSFRKGETEAEPLEIRRTAHCIWWAGIGHHTAAVDVNENWRRIDDGADRVLTSQLLDQVLASRGRTVAEFVRFMEGAAPVDSNAS